MQDFIPLLLLFCLSNFGKLWEWDLFNAMIPSPETNWVCSSWILSHWPLPSWASIPTERIKLDRSDVFQKKEETRNKNKMNEYYESWMRALFGEGASTSSRNLPHVKHFVLKLKLFTWHWGHIQSPGRTSRFRGMGGEIPPAWSPRGLLQTKQTVLKLKLFFPQVEHIQSPGRGDAGPPGLLSGPAPRP